MIVSGVCYHNGEGLSKDWSKAAHWFAAAAAQGYAQAQFNLGTQRHRRIEWIRCLMLSECWAQVSAMTKVKVWSKICRWLLFGMQPLQLKAMRRRSTILVCSDMSDRSVP